jgi:Fuc2NAc and GlcNAc transferase
MNDLILVTGALISGVTITGLVRRYAMRGGLIDTPNQRSSHENPTPRGGGLSIAVTFAALVILLYSMKEMPTEILCALLVGGGLVGGVGFLDDHRNVPATYRFAAHLAAAGIVIFAIGGFPPIQFGVQSVDLGWGGHVFAVLFLVWLTNLFNFMDGIDGIAATETIFIASAAIIISGTKPGHYLVALEAGLAAASLGFLFWNWPPARIFMGDVGSGYIGLTLGTIALVSASIGDLPIWTWLILASVFIVDSTVTLVRRMMSGQKWYSAHRSHAYQRAARRWESHKFVTGSVGVINVIWLLPLAWFSALRPEFACWLLLTAWVPLGVIALFLGAGQADED